MLSCRRLLLTKTPSPPQPDTEMRRVLSAWDLTLLGLGAIVGTGIFVLSGQVAATHTGPSIMLCFLLAGFAAALAGLCYAEVACMMPGAGSAYSYAYASLGELVAWVIGWDLLLEYVLAAAAVSVGWSAYVVAFVSHVFHLDMPRQLAAAPLRWDAATSAFARTGAWLNLPAILIVLLLTLVLALGVRESARFNALTVAIKLAAILAFVVFAAPAVDPNNWQPFVPPNDHGFGLFGWSGVLQGTTIVFFCYNGFDAITTAAQEAKHPDRAIPRGILASLALACVLYLAVSAVLCGVVPFRALAVPHPISVGLQHAGLRWLMPLVEVGSIAGLTSVMLVNLFSQPRIAFAMARDGLLPKALGRLHGRARTPYISTLAGGLVCALLGGVLPVDVLGELMCVGTLFAFALVSLGTLVLRRKQPTARRPFRVPGGAYGIPLLSTCTCVGLLACAQAHTLLRFAGWQALGILLYAIYGYRHSRVHRSEIQPPLAPRVPA